MSGLTPKQIFNGFKNKEIDKGTAVNYLKSYIENSEDEKLRFKSCIVLLELIPKNIDTLKLFENLLVSDNNDKIRAIGAKYIIKNFLDNGLETINWAIEHENSGHCLLTILKELKVANTEKSLNLIQVMKRTVGKLYIEKYGVVPSEALALGILNSPNNYVISFNDGVDGAGHCISFDTKDGHIIRIYGKQTFPNLKILEMFPYLKKLEINYAYTKDLKGLSNLKNLEILELDTVDIDIVDSIKEINSLVNLKELSILSNDKIDRLNFISNLVNLKKLTITGGIDWEWFGKISEIEGLDLMINLRELNIIGNKITEIKGIGSLQNLKRLSLCGNKIKEIKGLDNLINLKSLDLSGNNIKEIKDLDKLANLEYLNLAYNKITELNVKTFENLINLKRVKVTGNNIPKKQIELLEEKFENQVCFQNRD